MTNYVYQAKSAVPGKVEIRGFMLLRDIFKERNWPIPYYYKLEQECDSLALANKVNYTPPKRWVLLAQYD